MPWYCQYCGYETIRSAPFGRKDCPGCKRYSHWQSQRPSEEAMEANRQYLLEKQRKNALPDLEHRDVSIQESPSSANAKRQQAIMFLTQRNEARYLLEECRATLLTTQVELEQLRAGATLPVPRALLAAEDFGAVSAPADTAVGPVFEALWLGQPIAATALEALADLSLHDQAGKLKALAALAHPVLLRAYGVAALPGSPGLCIIHERLPGPPGRRPPGGLPLPDALGLVAQLGSALQYLHACGFCCPTLSSSLIITGPPWRFQLHAAGAFPPVAYFADNITGLPPELRGLPPAAVGTHWGPPHDTFALCTVVRALLQTAGEEDSPLFALAERGLDEDPSRRPSVLDLLRHVQCHLNP